ncbi:hypothetical protein BDN72DRAFT_899683 [Pluteus cervinus]|uniref:Uncharacterized protein n=1 Tax=Pluteus cervinus TaxID=181527 RepID=A0ACD3AMA7_9AGAR|nr:hypothetical protein BDN72DRAFT_899683 [Pluteus cervinus]
MAPRKWADPVQQGWIAARYPAFKAAQEAGTVAAWFDATYKDWFKDFDKEEDEDFVAKRRGQLHNSFYNFNAPKVGKQVLPDPVVKTCPNRPHEVYSQLFYKKDNLADSVRLDLEGQTELKKKTLPAINAAAKRAFDAADETKKAAVRTEIQCRKDAEQAAKEGKTTPESYNEAIRTLPSISSKFLKDLSTKTGWCFRLLAGGPHPSLGGELDSFALDIGKDVNGRRFNEARIVNSQQEVFLGWLEDAYPKHIRQSRALASDATEELPPQEPIQHPPSPPSDEEDEHIPRKPANALELSKLYHMEEEDEDMDELHPHHPLPQGQSNPSLPLASVSGDKETSQTGGATSASPPPSSLEPPRVPPPAPSSPPPSSLEPPRVPPPAPSSPSTVHADAAAQLPLNEVQPPAERPIEAAQGVSPAVGAPPSRQEATPAHPPQAVSPNLGTPPSQEAAPTPPQSTSPTPGAPPLPATPPPPPAASPTLSTPPSREATPAPPQPSPTLGAPPSQDTASTSQSPELQTGRRVRKPAKTRDLTTVAGEVIDSGPAKRKAGSSSTRASKKRKA